MSERTASCLAKLERMTRALHHEEPDRVPVSDFFWGSFLERWRRELGLPADVDIYAHYDLDWQVTVPNMDPHIRPFEVLRETAEEVLVRTGFDAVLRKRFDAPMPEFVAFDTDTIDKVEAFEFDDPVDPRRFFHGGDNQIAGVGDGYARDLPAWVDTVASLRPNFPVYGSQCEANEYLARIIGPAHALLWMGLHPERMGCFVERTNAWALALMAGQIEAAKGHLDGMVIWGDVAYRTGMLFHPDYWRQYFKPGLAAMVQLCHDHDLPVIYHGCGDVRPIIEDFIEVGVDALNPLEAKAGLDIVDLRRRYGHRVAFCGNMDVMDWAQMEEKELRATVLRKLNAAKGGGLIFQSDHSVPDSVSGHSYDYVVRLVREVGRYPLDLGVFDDPEMG